MGLFWWTTSGLFPYGFDSGYTFLRRVEIAAIFYVKMDLLSRGPCWILRSFSRTLFQRAPCFRVLAELDLLRSWKETTAYKNDLHLLPIQLNELAAYLHLLALGAVLTVFTQECSLYSVELPLVCLRRTRNPTPISALTANMSFVH